jgi:hypothetical protein
MAHIDLDNYTAVPRHSPQEERERRLQHTKSMLCASLVGAISIVVVAALFMTLF